MTPCYLVLHNRKWHDLDNRLLQNSVTILAKVLSCGSDNNTYVEPISEGKTYRHAHRNMVSYSTWNQMLSVETRKGLINAHGGIHIVSTQKGVRGVAKSVLLYA